MLSRQLCSCPVFPRHTQPPVRLQLLSASFLVVQRLFLSFFLLVHCCDSHSLACGSATVCSTDCLADLSSNQRLLSLALSSSNEVALRRTAPRDASRRRHPGKTLFSLLSTIKAFYGGPSCVVLLSTLITSLPAFRPMNSKDRASHCTLVRVRESVCVCLLSCVSHSFLPHLVLVNLTTCDA